MSTFPPRPSNLNPAADGEPTSLSKPAAPEATSTAQAEGASHLPARPTLPSGRPQPPSLSTQRPQRREVAETYEASEAEIGVTFEDLLTKDYNESYGYLEETVLEYKTWLQDLLQEQGLETEVGEARAQRGQKYAAMQARLQTLLMRRLLSEQRDYARRAQVEGEKDDNYKIATLVTNEILGLGPIEPLWVQPGITEIMVNGPYRVRIERNGKLIDVPGAKFRDQQHAMDVAQQILLPLGRSIDVKKPYENGRLPDGSRVHITHPSIGPDGPFITVRRFPEKPFSLRALIKPENPKWAASMSDEMALDLANWVAKGCSAIIAGGTGSGKTSMLNALSGAIDRGERIITIEDNIELQLHPNADRIALEARRSRTDESAAVTIRDLVRETLRMRPDRIIVGEVRDSSAYDMLQAMTTGHEGSMTTVHANDVQGTVERLVGLIQQSGEADTTRALSMIAGGVDLIVMVDRFPEDGSRRITAIAEVPPYITKGVGGSGDTLEPRIIWEFEQTSLETDENGEERVVGHWVKRNELSEGFVRRKRLTNKHTLTLDEALELSDTSE